MFWQRWEPKLSKAHVHHKSLCSKPMYASPSPSEHNANSWAWHLRTSKFIFTSCHPPLTLGTILLLYPPPFLPYPKCILHFFLLLGLGTNSSFTQECSSFSLTTKVINLLWMALALSLQLIVPSSFWLHYSLSTSFSQNFQELHKFSCVPGYAVNHSAPVPFATGEAMWQICSDWLGK